MLFFVLTDCKGSYFLQKRKKKHQHKNAKNIVFICYE